MLSYLFFFVLWSLGCVCIGSILQEHFNGSARITKGMWLNDSHPIVKVTLPAGVRFTGFGGCYPTPRLVGDGPVLWDAFIIDFDRPLVRFDNVPYFSMDTAFASGPVLHGLSKISSVSGRMQFLSLLRLWRARFLP
jgi:hypothetical protein